ncbi:MAG: DUF1295 domain-containing protein [Phycisphaerae bacterium]
MLSLQWLLLLGLALISLAMLWLWAVQLRTRNAGTVDIAWSAGIGSLALLFAALGEGEPRRKWIVAGMTAIWSYRLAYYLLHRVTSETEDGRYQELRAQSGEGANRFFFWFFQFQAVLVLLFAIPPLVAMRTPGDGLRVWDYLGIAIWIVAIVGESIADRQLAAFRRDPANRGKTCRAGLWRYSRHPNYFFEFVHWFAYCAIAVGHPYGWITLLGPALMIFFLFKVTGIPPTEARAARSRPDYAEYQRTTSMFVPWFPKEISS